MTATFYSNNSQPAKAELRTLRVPVLPFTFIEIRFLNML